MRKLNVNFLINSAVNCFCFHPFWLVIMTFISMSVAVSDYPFSFSKIVDGSKVMNSSLVLYSNSTSCLISVTFSRSFGNSIATVLADSSLHVSNCTAFQCKQFDSYFKSSGILKIGKMKFITSPITISLQISSLVNIFSPYDVNSISLKPHRSHANSLPTNVILSDSTFADAILEVGNGSLVSNGKLFLQNVDNCDFHNLTTSNRNDEKAEGGIGLVSFCKLSNSLMENVEDFFYGRIVSGMTLKTKNTFDCKNCTFLRCFRNHNTIYNNNNNNNNNNERGEKKKKEKQQIFNNNGKRKNNNNFNNVFLNKNQEIQYNYTNETFLSDNITERNVSNSFYNCTFSGCRCASAEGGALYLNAASTELYVDSCVFDNCFSQKGGGGIYCNKSNYFRCLSSSFTDCEGRAYSGGGVYTSTIKVCCEVSYCNFTRCICGQEGGGMFVSSVIGKTCFGNGSSESYPIFRCIFDSCQCNSGSGLHYYIWKDPQKILSCTLRNGTALVKGGGLYLYGTFDAESVIDFFFEKNVAYNEIGKDVYIEYSSEEDAYNPFKYSFSLSGKNRVCGFGAFNGLYKDFVNDAWLPYPYKIVNKGEEASDECGNEELPCVSIAYVIKTFSLEDENSKEVFKSFGEQVKVLEEDVEVEELKIRNGVLAIFGSGKEKSFIYVNNNGDESGKSTDSSDTENTDDSSDSSGNNDSGSTSSTDSFNGNSLFSVSQGSLSLKDLCVLINSSFDKYLLFMDESGSITLTDISISSSDNSNNIISKTLINISAGSFDMNEVVIDGFNMSSGSYIAYLNNPFCSISSCQFKNNDLSNSLNSVVFLSNNEERLIIKGIAFDNCKVDSSFSFLEIDLRNIYIEVEFMDWLFIRYKETVGKNVVFTSTNYNDLTDVEDWGNVKPEYNEENKENYVITFTDQSFSMSFLYLLYPPQPDGDGICVVHVNNESDYERIYCGWTEIPCNSMSYGLKGYYGEEEKRLELDNNISEYEVMDMSGTEVVSASEEKVSITYGVTIVSNSTETVAITNERPLSFKNIIFNLPNSILIITPRFMDSSLSSKITSNNNILTFIMSSSDLSFEDCEFKSDINKPITYSLFQFSVGKLSASNLIMNTISFGEGIAPFIIEFDEFRECSLEDVSIKNVNLASSLFFLIRKDEGKDSTFRKIIPTISFLKAEFINISTTNDNNISSVLSSESFLVYNTSFLNCSVKNCTSPSDKGGAFYITLGNSGTSFISNLVFDGCKCDKSHGKGGCLFLDCASDKNSAPPFYSVLPFQLKDSTFTGNDAWSGKNLHIYCTDVASQIKEELFKLNLDFGEENTFTGRGIEAKETEDDIDLLYLLTLYISEKIFVSTKYSNSSDSDKCGSTVLPCLSLTKGVAHVINGSFSNIIIIKEAELKEEVKIKEVSIVPYEEENSIIYLKNYEYDIGSGNPFIIIEEDVKFSKVDLIFMDSFTSKRKSIFDVIKGGNLTLSNLIVCVDYVDNDELLLDSYFISVESEASLIISSVNISDFYSTCPILRLNSYSDIYLDSLLLRNISLSLSPLVEIKDYENSNIKRYSSKNDKDKNSEIVIDFRSCSFLNILRSSEGPCAISAVGKGEEYSLLLDNLTCSNCSSESEKGSVLLFDNCLSNISSSSFNGVRRDGAQPYSSVDDLQDLICDWEGGMINIKGGNCSISESTISNSSVGALQMEGNTNVTIQQSSFSDNKIEIQEYSSVRRNIKCISSSLNIISLKGGDGMQYNTSLWISNEECDLFGIPDSYLSPLYIPSLSSVTYDKDTFNDTGKLTFEGSYLIPCSLSFQIRVKSSSSDSVSSFNGVLVNYINETRAEGEVGKEVIKEWNTEEEISVVLLVADKEINFSDGNFVHEGEKNISDDTSSPSGNGDFKWAFVLFLICLFIIVALIVVFFFAFYKYNYYKNKYKKLEEDNEDNNDKELYKDIEMEEEESRKLGDEEEKDENNEEEEKSDSNKEESDVDEEPGISRSSLHFTRTTSGKDMKSVKRSSKYIPQSTLLLSEKVDLDSTTTTEDIKTSDLLKSTSSISVDSTSISGISTMVISDDNEKEIFVKECFYPYEEKKIKKYISLSDYLHHRVSSGSLKYDSSNVATATLSTIDINSNVNMGRSIFKNVISCLSYMNSMKEEKLYSICSYLSTYSIILDQNPNLEDLEEGRGVYISLQPPSEEEKSAALRYAPPEMDKVGEEEINKLNTSENKEKAIVFMLGLIGMECMSGEVPFSEETDEDAHFNIKKQKLPSLEYIEEDDMKEILNNMLLFSPSERPDMKEVDSILNNID